MFGAYSVFAKETIPPITPPTPTPADPRFEQFKGACSQYKLAFKEPSENAADRVAVFGPADNPAHLASVDFFGYAVQVNRRVAPCLEAVVRDLTAQGTAYHVVEVGGYRKERADRPYWFHQYGGAVDINPATNPICTGDLGGSYEGVEEPGRCALDKPYDLPQAWVDTFERYGFYWGGNYERGKDYMHFEWYGGKV